MGWECLYTVTISVSGPSAPRAKKFSQSGVIRQELDLRDEPDWSGLLRSRNGKGSGACDSSVAEQALQGLDFCAGQLWIMTSAINRAHLPGFIPPQ